MTLSDLTSYVPHGMIVMATGLIGYVFKQHAAQDDRRFSEIQDGLKLLAAGQDTTQQRMADNHAAVLKLFIEASQSAATNAAIAAVAASRHPPSV